MTSPIMFYVSLVVCNAFDGGYGETDLSSIAFSTLKVLLALLGLGLKTVSGSSGPCG